MADIHTTRFAPSPTGRLHLGHAYSALLAHDFAREHSGQFLLRIEDIDHGRCRAAFVDDIIADLRWLGLDWDGPIIFQSHRMALYSDALERLKAMGLAYRCWCTRAEIAASASAPHGDEGPVYPGTCKGRTDPGDDRPFCWRLDVDAAMKRIAVPLSWNEAGRGAIVAEPPLLGDVVLARKDAGTSYHIAVTIDDAAQDVTDIIRGQDLFSSTHVHRLLQALLGLPTPRYHHHPLLLDEQGERLAKRRNAPSLASMREDGMDPKPVVEGLRDGRFPVGIVTEKSKG